MFDRLGLLSPWLQRMRMAAALPEINGRVLDVGCGDGALALQLKRESYVGVEPNPLNLRLAMARAPGYDFRVSIPEEKFDTIAALAVIEHLNQPEVDIADWISHLKPKGRLVITTPKRGFKWLHTLAASTGLASKGGAEEHKIFFNYKSMTKLVARLPVRLVLYRGLLFGLNQLFVFESILN
jgi:SAM-dependent methyltransferase